MPRAICHPVCCSIPVASRFYITKCQVLLSSGFTKSCYSHQLAAEQHFVCCASGQKWRIRLPFTTMGQQTRIARKPVLSHENILCKVLVPRSQSLQACMSQDDGYENPSHSHMHARLLGVPVCLGTFKDSVHHQQLKSNLVVASIMTFKKKQTKR